MFAVGLAFFASSGCSTLDRPGTEISQAGQSPTTLATLAPGLEYYRADEGTAQGPVNWFISLGVVRNPAEGDRAKDCASQLQLQPRFERFTFSGERPATYDEITLGAFSSRAATQMYVDRHPHATDCKPEIKASPLYPSDHSAPAIVHVLSLDPSSFEGQLVASRDNSAAYGRAKPSAVLLKEKGLAASNGGFFVMEPTDGVVGESTGISVIAGALQSEPTKGRPWVLIENGSRVRVTLHDKEPEQMPSLYMPDGARTQLDGVNRAPGLLRNCGSLIDPDFSTPVHDVTCRPLNEIVALTSQPSEGIKLSDGQVAYRFKQNHPLIETDRGQIVSTDEILLVASGNRKSELAALAASREPLRLDLGNFGGDSKTYALNGGPMLLSNGHPVAKEDVQGWPFAESSLDQANAMHRFINLRAPRTALGIKSSGEILIVVVDGWRYRTDAAAPVSMNGGMTIEELADLMRNLGARDAINLDGGGSSVMALKNGIASNPSDEDGERAVGDTLLVLP